MDRQELYRQRLKEANVDVDTLYEEDQETKEELPQDDTAPQASTTVQKDVKDYNLGDNVKEASKAVVAGGIDFVNSVGSLPKLFDKRFYQATDPNNPYTFDAPWIIKSKPITRTRWGKFIQGGVELAGGFVGAGKVMWGMKGLKGLAAVGKTTRVGRVAMGAAQGAAYDVISNQSQEQNLARALIDIKPEWATVLDPVATKENMSPALKSIYNIGEGLMIGGLFDAAIEAGGWGIRSYSINAKKAAKKNKLMTPLQKAVDKSEDIDYAAKASQVEIGAKVVYEKRRAKIGKSPKKGKPLKPWANLSKTEKQEVMESFAKENGIEWGSTRDMSTRASKQAKAQKELAEEQLEFDLSKGSPRENPAYYKGGDSTDNPALSSSDNPVEGVRDQIKIRNDLSQKDGSPRGTLTEANIRRIEYSAPGTTIEELDKIAESLGKSPAYLELEGAATKDDLKVITEELMKFINESGNSRLIDIPSENLEKWVKTSFGKPDEITVATGNQVSVFNHLQVRAADVLLGQLLKESRDLAQAGLSVMKEVDLSAQGSLLDNIMARYGVIARLRKEASATHSWRLRAFGGLDEYKKTMAKASQAAQNEVNTFKTLLRSDIDDDLLEQFMHFTATGGGKAQTWKDFDAFFKRKLRGYKGADGYNRNAVLNEMATMGVNSMLSGPKTPVRALVGTGLGTVLRPVATVVGALGKGNDRVLRGAYHSLGAMVEARNEAWAKAIADFKGYQMHEEGWRGFTQQKVDAEWNAMMKYMDTYGTVGDKAQAKLADSLRNINKLPFLNYGPRIMKSMDVFFSQIIARARQRQLAFDDVYSRTIDSGKVVSDTDLDNLVRQTEKEFEGRVFSADGEITDEMAIFAGNEAKLTQELTGFAKDLDKAFSEMPFLRPYFLFARTGVNALMMTTKYTPLLNRVLKENADIMSKAWDDPDMIQYGIKSQADLEIAQSVAQGRVAIGYGVTATAAWMALNGDITGNGPPDRQLKNTWMQNKWQPRSFRIGDVYVSYEALEPFNSFFSLAADIADAQKVMGDEWAGNWYGKLAYMISSNVTNKTFLAGLMQIQDLLTSQGGDAPRALANLANNQIPLSGMRNEIGKVLSPGMRELESGFWQSIGNRNLWADVVTPGELLPYRYDILDGSKLKDWNPIVRLVNAILPISLNVGTNETREMLFRSGLNLKQTFNTGPNGESLEGYPDLKSKYQFFMGQQNIEKQLETLFLKNNSIRDSIFKMERDRDRGDVFEASNTVHGKVINEVFRTAKSNAWKMLIADPEYGGKAQRLNFVHQLQLIGNKKRRKGDYKGAKNISDKIKDLEKLPYK
tara:strand:- start:1189 stop:5139 length:3951 start_codon:yes stop_codon:yes gene_type:complete